MIFTSVQGIRLLRPNYQRLLNSNDTTKEKWDIPEIDHVKYIELRTYGSTTYKIDDINVSSQFLIYITIYFHLFYEN